jgi:chloride channel protein, CIC family
MASRAILLSESFSQKACSPRLPVRAVVVNFLPRLSAESSKWYKVKMQSGDRPRLLFDSVLLGIIGGLGAQLFMWMLRISQDFFLTRLAGYHPPGLPEEGGVLRQVIGPHGLWLVPVAATLGGLISGALVYGLAPETEGHGTDTVVKAVHFTGSVLRARVAPVKMLASAITIGSGGSAGREGPIALIAAGFGSVYASLWHRPERERRLLVLMGMAAGLSAIFRSPIGTAVFAVEVLYGGMDFEADALMYCMLAAIVAYAVNGWFVGWQSLFRVPSHLSAAGLAEYGWYIALGAASGIVATILPEVFYRVRDAFAAIRIPNWIKPAIGGLGLGLLALRLPQVLGGGYGWIQEAIDGHLVLHLLLILLFAKIVALSLTVSSGGSGGVFAPSLFVGAMLGGVFAGVFHHASAGLVIVGMASVFGGAARVPIATLLMVVEMTGGYQLLVPAGLAVMLSFLIQTNLSSVFRYGSLYEAQVAGRVDSPAHRAENVRIAMRLLDQGKVSLPPQVNHLHLAALLQSGLALDLPDGSQLMAGALRPESPWVGKQIRARALSGPIDDAKIVAVLRGKSVMLARPETVLQPGDRLLLIAPRQARPELAQHLAPPPALNPQTGTTGTS